jgi:hypothetical protein
MSHFILFGNYNVLPCEILCSTVVLINFARGSRLSLQLALFCFLVLSYTVMKEARHFFTLFGLQGSAPLLQARDPRDGGR